MIHNKTLINMVTIFLLHSNTCFGPLSSFQCRYRLCSNSCFFPYGHLQTYLVSNNESFLPYHIMVVINLLCFEPLIPTFERTLANFDPIRIRKFLMLKIFKYRIKIQPSGHTAYNLLVYIQISAERSHQSNPLDVQVACIVAHIKVPPSIPSNSETISPLNKAKYFCHCN